VVDVCGGVALLADTYVALLPDTYNVYAKVTVLESSGWTEAEAVEYEDDGDAVLVFKCLMERKKGLWKYGLV